MKAGPIRLLLTVPHLESTASPYREMMAVARYLPRPEFSLTICSLRENGLESTGPLLESLGARVFVARYRPRGRGVGHFRSCLRDQKVISGKGPFDLQHSLDFSSTPIEAALARRSKRRFLFSQRNLNEGGHLWLLRMKCRLSRKVVVISAAVQTLLQSAGLARDKIVEIGLGIEEDAASAFPAGELPVPESFVLSVGQIVRRKRHEDGIAAFARIAAERPDLHFLIAGRVVDAGYAEELRRLAGDRGLESRISFLGPRPDVMALMKRAECLLHCPESEAFGWVLLEAMAAGVPIVASAVGGIRQVLEDGKTGMLVPAGDVEGLALAMRRLLDEPETARSLVREALAVVRERYSAAAMVRRLAEVYRDVSGEGLSTA